MNGNRLLLKLARPIYLLLKPLLPLASKYLQAYRSLKQKNLYHAGAVTVKDFCFVEKKLKNEPLISVVVPVFNPETVHFLEMVYSIVNQHYINWELVLVNASSSETSRKITEDCTGIDTRIKVVNVTNNGIASNTNAGIKNASGEFIAFLDHDDLLHPCALHSAAEALQNKNNQPTLIYTDEDKISDDSSRYFDPHYKPSWSPDLLRNVNYINHLTLIKKEHVDRVKGLRTECDGAQDYDLLLRVIDACAPNIKHIPRVLYHWRAAKKSTAQDISTKEYIFKAGVKALSDHLERNKIPAKVAAISGKPGFYEVKYKPADCSIIIGPVSPRKYGACYAWLEKIGKRLPENSEVIIGGWYKDFINHSKLKDVKIKYVESEKPNEYWLEACRLAAHKVSVCFKDAAIAVSADGIEHLVSAAAYMDNAVVAPIIVSEDKTILNAGIINAGGLQQKLFEGYKFGRYTFFGNTDWVRNVDDLSTGIIAIKTNKLKDLLESSTKNYGSADTFCSLLPKDNLINPIVWAHSPFLYLGSLQFKRDNYYHNIQQFKFIQHPFIFVDNWGEKYEREED